MATEINTIMPLVQKRKVIKIIIESGILTDEEITRCCDIYGAAGVDFMKTSTGYAEREPACMPPQLDAQAFAGFYTN